MQFSIVIPAFNAEMSIGRTLSAIEALVGQIIFEVLVVDDGSIDDTAEIVSSFKGKFDLKYIRNVRNSGAAYSRNIGVLNSKNETIVFNDCDDESLIIRFNEHAKHLIGHPRTLSYVSSQKRYGRIEREFKLEKTSQKTIEVKELIRFLLLGKKIPELAQAHYPSSCLAISKEFFLEVGGFDESMFRNEDVDFLVRALKTGGRISASDLIGVIRHAGVAPHQSGSSNLRGELRLLDKYGQEALSRREVLSSKFWFTAKAHYFEQEYFRALLKWLLSGVLSPSRLFTSLLTSMPRRVKHDLKVRYRS